MKSKNQQRRERKKLKREEQKQDTAQIDESEPKPTNKSLELQARKYDWLNENDPMYELYNQVSSRFKRRWSEPEETVEESREEETLNELVTEHQQLQLQLQLQQAQHQQHQQEPISKKQLRRITKPSLAELKEKAAKPELIEWFDADAKYPEFLVRMKCLPHAVQVPSHWQNRSEIPKFGVKPPYELPRNIVETNIKEAWKNGELDIDYEKMHAAFFESEPAKLNLLPYGQVLDIRLRRAAFKPEKVRRAPPKSVSDRLRKALGVPKSSPMPWESIVKSRGLAPGYAHAPTLVSSERWGAYIE